MDTRVLDEARESFLYSDPRWLGTVDTVLPGLTAFHAVATRREGEVAVLPAFIIAGEPGRSDLDPRYFLGEPETASCCGGSVTNRVTIADDDVFPCLVIGSPSGFHSEPFFTFWDDRLLSEMVSATHEFALTQGVRSILAPHVPDRLVGMNIGEELEALGGSTAFLCSEFFLPLMGSTFEKHLASLPRAQRLRLRGDFRRGGASVDLKLLDGTALAALLPDISRLIAATYDRNGIETPISVIGLMLQEAINAFPVFAACAFDASTDELLAVHILIYQQPRLYGKWFGQEESTARESIYFPLLAALPLQLALDLGAKTLELGPGSAKAKVMRGGCARRCRTSLWFVDSATNSLASSALHKAGQDRSRLEARVVPERAYGMCIGATGMNAIPASIACCDTTSLRSSSSCCSTSASQTECCA
jgi:hypothetical protein